MDKNKYLENYYKENNPLAARLTIDKKLIKCILICVITTLIYLFIIIFSKVSNIHAFHNITSYVHYTVR